jgi:hypothetical protein
MRDAGWSTEVADFIWVTVLRLAGALAVLVAPLPALWLSGHLDRWDWSLLDMPVASAHGQHVYQYWDKVLDTFTLAIALIVALSWKDGLARRLAIATAAWRVAGVAAFMATGQREVLVVFPSVFEKLFFFYLLFRVLSRREIMLRNWGDAAVTMVALTIPKIAEEYFIHVGTRPWQSLTLLPSAVTTPDREYWVWMPIMLALPALAMARLLLQRRQPGDERIPLVTALLGRQVSRTSGWSPAPVTAVGTPSTAVYDEPIEARA